ncbi:MAG TPA: DUF2232 domain-containing protein [Thermoanaerobaculia bacterium]|jgi:hypothetical protein
MTSDAHAEPQPSTGRFELPLAALTAAACFSAIFLIPLVGALGVAFAAVPTVRLAHRRGFLTGALACSLAAAVVFGVAWAIGDLAESVVMALLAEAVTLLPTAAVAFLRAGSDPSRCYLGVVLAGCGILGALFAASAGGPGPSISAEAVASFDRMTPAVVDSYSKSGADAATVASVRAMLAGAKDLASRYLWGVFGALWVLAAAMAFYGGAAGARPSATAETVRFSELRVPPLAAGLFVASGSVFAVGAGELRRAAGNLLLPLLALYFVAGLSIICHFLRRWVRARFLRAGLYVLAGYFPINVAVALMGLFDWYVDFRRRGEGLPGDAKGS